jgi:Holliday junction resolvase
MVNGRNKGASYEREIAKMLFDELGIGFKRDLEQYRAGAHADLIADDPDFPFTLELKRYKDGKVGGSPSWWAQVEVAAEREGKIPCLIYKYDRKQNRCVMPLSAVMDGGQGKIETDLETFCFIVREKLGC